MSGYPAGLGELIVYPLPAVWPLWTYFRMKGPQPRHTASLVCALLTIAIQGLSLLAGYRPGMSLALFAALASLFCLFIPPWRGDVKNGVSLRAVNALIGLLYSAGMMQAWGLD